MPARTCLKTTCQLAEEAIGDRGTRLEIAVESWEDCRIVKKTIGDWSLRLGKQVGLRLRPESSSATKESWNLKTMPKTSTTNHLQVVAGLGELRNIKKGRSSEKEMRSSVFHGCGGRFTPLSQHAMTMDRVMARPWRVMCCIPKRTTTMDLSTGDP